MAQSIKFTDPKTDTEYTLEYDRDSVRFAEDLGINIVELVRGKVKPATLWTQLFPPQEPADHHAGRVR